MRRGVWDMIDFTAYRHPVLAVGCTECGKRAGVWCIRPSGHRAAELHKARRLAADALFVAQHGEDASIERTGAGWIIDPIGRVDRNRIEQATGVQLELFR